MSESQRIAKAILGKSRSQGGMNSDEIVRYLRARDVEPASMNRAVLSRQLREVSGSERANLEELYRRQNANRSMYDDDEEEDLVVSPPRPPAREQIRRRRPEAPSPRRLVRRQRTPPQIIGEAPPRVPNNSPVTPPRVPNNSPVTPPRAPPNSPVTPERPLPRVDRYVRRARLTPDEVNVFKRGIGVALWDIVPKLYERGKLGRYVPALRQ